MGQRIMPFIDLFHMLESLDPNLTIYMASPWEINSRSCVDLETGDGKPSEFVLSQKLSYFLEVELAKEFASDYAEAMGIDKGEAVVAERIIRYAINDA